MKKAYDVTKENLFNWVAPIHVFHHADIMYKSEAKKAFKELKKASGCEMVKSYFGEEAVVLKEKTIETIDSEVFWRVYNQLFEEIVKESFPAFSMGYDMYGAKCFRLGGAVYLAGDVHDCFPFYVDMESLKERLEDLSDEVA